MTRRSLSPVGTVGVAALSAVLAATGTAVVLARRSPPTAVLAGAPTTLQLYAGPPQEAAASAPDVRTTGPNPVSGPARPPPAGSSSGACVQSFDPACGDFYWAPPAGPNTPIDLSVTIEPPFPAAGQLVVITVTWSDREANAGFDHLETPMACEPHPDGSCDTTVALPATNSPCTPPFGPWPPPPPRPSEGSTRYLRAYAEPGVYTWTVRVSAFTIGAPHPCDPDPWAEQLERRGAISVRPPPPTTTSTSTTTTTTTTATTTTATTTTARP